MNYKILINFNKYKLVIDIKENLVEIRKLLTSILNTSSETNKSFTTELIGINGKIKTLDDSFEFKQDLLTAIQSFGIIKTVEQLKFQTLDIIKRLDEEIKKL